LAAQLYADPALKAGKLAKYVSTEVEGEKQITELNTGLWWEKTETEVAEKSPVLRCVILGVALRCIVSFSELHCAALM